MTPAVVVLLVLAALTWPGRATPGERTWSAAGLRRVRRRDELGLEEAAALAELLAMGLRSGGAPARVVEVVAPDVPDAARVLLDELGRELAAGRTGEQTWARWAGEHPALAPCASAWRLSQRCGVPLAPALEQAACSARAALSARRRLDAASAGARATMGLLTLLPVVGLLAGLALGVSPAALLGSPAALVSLATGVVLTVLGWATSRAVLRRATRPRSA